MPLYVYICMQVPGSVGRKIPLGKNRKAVDVDIGESAVCALLDNGTVKCWGTGSGVGSKYSTVLLYYSLFMKYVH
jgi:hypothetical protein